MKSVLVILFSSFGLIMGLSFTNIGVESAPSKTGKDNIILLIDSLKHKLELGRVKTIQLKAKNDTLKELNEFLTSVKLTHNDTAYNYPNLRLKLIYKWVKGTPGHWELYKKVHY